MSCKRKNLNVQNAQVMVGATVTCRPATFPLPAVRARSVGRERRRGSERAVTPGQPLGFPRGSRRVVVIPVAMAAPITANKRCGAKLRAGSARGMACRQSRSTV
jgi:hypothetical protein